MWIRATTVRDGAPGSPDSSRFTRVVRLIFPLFLKNDLFRDNLSVGTVAWPVRMVLYKCVALVSCFSCYSPWCVLLCCRRSGVERVALLDWYCEWIGWCPPLTQSLALYYLCSNLYYALLSYFLSTPISDFTTGVDPLKLPPIYYSTDDLLNFIFVMVAYL